MHNILLEAILPKVWDVFTMFLGQSARRSAVMFAICNISIIRSFGRIVEKRKVF